MSRWYRQDGNADYNPRMRRAGFWGRTVYWALLRISADFELDGVVPERYADPDYLAERLGLAEDPVLAPLWASGLSPRDACRNGVTAAVTAGLVRFAGSSQAPGELFIVGWEERNEVVSPGAQRQKRYRENLKRRQLELEAVAQHASHASRVTSRDGTHPPTHDTHPPTTETPSKGLPKRDEAELFHRVMGRLNELRRGKRPFTSSPDLLARIRAGTTEAELLRVVEGKVDLLGFKGGKHYAPATLFGADNFARYSQELTAGPSAGDAFSASPVNRARPGPTADDEEWLRQQLARRAGGP